MSIPVRATQEGHFNDSLKSVGDIFMITDKTVRVYQEGSNVPQRDDEGKLLTKTIKAEKQFSHAWMEKISMEEYMRERSGEEELAEDEIPLEPNPPAEAGNAVTSDMINEVLNQLDPENDDHWTARGEPAMDAIESLGGFAASDVSRSDVKAANPVFTRDLARASRVDA